MLELTIEMALLHAGASIVYARSLVPDTLFRLLATQHVTVMVLVPQALQLFLNGVEREVRKQNKEKLWEILHTIAARLPFKYRRHLFGYLDKHHNLYLKGRKKNMIVLANRMNVYPEDVENTLQQQETVKNAVVFGLHERNNSRRFWAN